MTQEHPAMLPLFYKAPQLLHAKTHARWRLEQGDAGFAAGAPAIPLVLSDFVAASRCYPILFAAGEAAPLALVGLENSNLFIDDGAWADGAYVPAYVRRYPFILIEAPDKSGFGLAIDSASPSVARGGAAGEPLFQKGEPSAMVKRALEFCRLFKADHSATCAFSAALLAERLLVERKADATLRDGRKFGVGGFQVVDPERFAELSEEKVVAWHRAGWLAMIHAHLASLACFADLPDRQTRRSAALPADAANATLPSSPIDKGAIAELEEVCS